MEKIEFKRFSDITKDAGWQFRNNRPAGQHWLLRDNFITNGRGEGFSIHGGTKYDDKCAIVDALNKRDAEIARLKKDALSKDGRQ